MDGLVDFERPQTARALSDKPALSGGLKRRLSTWVMIPQAKSTLDAPANDLLALLGLLRI